MTCICSQPPNLREQLFLRFFRAKALERKGTLKPEFKGEHNIAGYVIAQLCNRARQKQIQVLQSDAFLEWFFRKLLSQENQIVPKEQ